MLTVGCADTMIEHDGLTDAFREFCATHPETAFQYNEYLMSDMLDMAGRRELDVIITTQFDAAALIDAGYNCKVLTLSSISIFMPLTNPLSERESIAISDLCTEQFIVLSPARNPNYISLLKDLCAQSGFEPRISTYVTSAHSFKVNLLMNQGIVLADNYTDIHHSGIKKFEIEGINYSEVIAWREDSSEAKALIRIIDKHFHSSAR